MRWGMVSAPASGVQNLLGSAGACQNYLFDADIVHDSRLCSIRTWICELHNTLIRSGFPTSSASIHFGCKHIRIYRAAKLDNNNRAFFLLRSCDRWLSVRLGMMGNFMVSAAALLAVSGGFQAANWSTCSFPSLGVVC